MKINEITLTEVDINQVASQLEFLPTRKQAKQYKFVPNGEQGKMPAMSYTVLDQDQLVVTHTTDGKETQKQAKAGDIMMSGPTRENYAIDRAKFGKNYQGEIGQTVVPEQSPRQVAHYTGDQAVSFMASWGEQMVLKPGDYLVRDGSHYYRIAKVEYEQTYNPPGK